MFQTGSLEKGDILVTLEPKPSKGIDIILKSKVEKLFGESIHQLVKNILTESEIQDVCVTLEDQGALDFVISARLKTTIRKMKRVSV